MAKNSMTPAQSDKQRHPSEIIGGIRQRIEWIMKRNEGLDEMACSNYSDTLRLSVLTDELESAQMVRDLTASKLLVALMDLVNAAKEERETGFSPDLAADIQNAQQIIASVEGRK